MVLIACCPGDASSLFSLDHFQEFNWLTKKSCWNWNYGRKMSSSGTCQISFCLTTSAISSFMGCFHHHNRHGRRPRTTDSHDQLQVHDWLYLCRPKFQIGWASLFYKLRKHYMDTSCQNFPEPDTNDEADTDDVSTKVSCCLWALNGF